MKQPKNIAPVLLLLLWAALLCFSVSYTATQLQQATAAAAPGTAAEEKLDSAEPGFPHTWTEPTPNHTTAGSHEPDTPLLFPFYTIGFSLKYRCSLKTTRSIPGFASLTSLFPILPNAP